MKKNPQQKRSRDTIQVMLQATARCIAKQGFDGTTSAKIAEEAGISIGSLYQYFENKEQLYNLLMETMIGEALSIIEQRVTLVSNNSIEQMVHILLEATWEFLEQKDGVYLEVVKHWTQLNFEYGIDLLEARFFQMFTLHLLQQPRFIPIEGLSCKLYILTNATLFSIIRYINKPPQQISREALTQQLAQMFSQSLL
jgi:AcrR family transcriptional regulator